MKTACLLIAAAMLLPALPTAAADPPGRPDAPQIRSTTLPARGLFEGDRLSAMARQRLAELVVDAIGLNVDVALVVPTGPWNTDGSGRDERDLTPARLEAVKRFLAERGVDPKRIYTESRIDQKLKEPRLDLQIVGRRAND